MMRRRHLLKIGGASLALAAATSQSLFSPRKARADAAPYKFLSPSEVVTIEALSDTLVPGARDAGVAHYIDHELVSPSPRLMLRFAQLRGPMAPYYRHALAAFVSAVGAQGHAEFALLPLERKHAVVEALRHGTIASWDAETLGAPVFYGMMRNDVVYGSVEGFAKLSIPYMPHIMPLATW